VAFIIDVVVINLIAALVAAAINLVASLTGHKPGLSTLEAIIGLVVWWLWIVTYFTAFWTFTGQTPGSRLMGIRVQRPDGRGLHALQALRRFAGVIVALLPLGIGILAMLVDDRRRGWQDRIGGTVVRWVPEEVADQALPETAGATGAQPGLEPAHPGLEPAHPGLEPGAHPGESAATPAQ
jgi:uncharacterized RDD family membrane protein YckC